MPPSANRGAEGLLRFAAILLPMAFVLMQISSTHRVSAPTVKLSVKLVGCCAVAAFMFALTMSSNNDLVPHDHFRTHAQRSSPVPSTAILRHLYRTKHQHSANSAGASSGVILERNRMRLICATPTCDDDRLLDEAFEAWLHSQQKDTVSPLRIANRPKAALPKELDALLEDALHEVQRCSSPAFENTPIGSFPHTPEGACVPSTPDFAQFHELSATSSIRAGPLSGSRRMSSDMDIASTSSRSDATPLGEVTKRWRHNPYTFRGFTLMDVDAHHHTVPITIRNGETSLVHDVRLDVLLKASQPPIDLRRRGKVNMEPKPPKNETAVPAAATPASKDSARAANPDAALARKNFKKACEQIKMPIEEPLYSVVVKLPSTASEIPSNWVASIDEGWTTLTGLPNADGHRVAEALLKHYEAIGVIRGEYSLSNDVRRMDRFNTGACHVMFNDTADAQRMQLQLRNDMVFAAFRDGRCVVSGAMD